MKKKYKLSSLVEFYINYIFQKTTILIFGISLILMVLILLLMTNNGNDEAFYLMSSYDIHKSYFEKALLIITIFNGIIISTIVITLIIYSNSFDSLFISYIPRNVICIAKILSIFIVVLIITLIEVGIIYLIPLIKYKLYKTDIDDLKLIYYLLLTNVFLIMIEVLFTTIFQSIFIPMVILFINISFKILSDSIYTLRLTLSRLMPIIGIEKNKYIIDGDIIGIVFISISFILYLSFYNIKDLKTI